MREPRTGGPTRPVLAVRSLVALVIVIPLVVRGVTGTSSSRVEAAAETAPVTLPVVFEANHGQADPAIRFIARARAYTVLATRAGITLALAAQRGERSPHRIDLAPAGMTGSAQLEGASHLPGTVNYFIGRNPARWHTDIPTYGSVVYRGASPGVDLRFYTRAGSLEYDWVVRPGASTDHLALRVGGASVQPGSDGDLLLQSGKARIRLGTPRAYSLLGQRRVPVASRFLRLDTHHIGVALGPHRSDIPLVVDPTLEYSSYLGGNDADGGYGLTIDREGNAYVTGDTQSRNFPLEGGVIGTLHSSASCANTAARLVECPDAFVAKISADGKELLYSTYLGGSGDDYGHGIAVDTAGNAYITGNTLSSDFPVVRALQSRFGGGRDLGDAYITRLNPQGNAILFSTYVGGSGEDDGEDIAVTGGDLYVAGSTSSANFPVSHPWRSHPRGRDAFALKMPKSGTSLTYSTYIGGSGGDGATGIAVLRGNAYIAGTTSSRDFPTVHPLQAFGGGTCGVPGQEFTCEDAFLTRLGPGGEAVYSTYIGGRGSDKADDVAVDRRGNAYVVGVTGSRNFPLVQPFQSTLEKDGTDGFVSKINPSGTRFIFSTYLGGSDDDEAYGVAVDAGRNIYVTGSTISADFPTRNALQARLPVGEDTSLGLNNTQNAFVSVFKPDGRDLYYSTYLGGTDHDLGGHIAADNAGNAYITGFATSTDFPVTKGAVERKHRGGVFDAFVARIFNAVPARAASTGACKKGYTFVRGACVKSSG